MVKNLLTVDLEDWHQLAYWRITSHLIPPTENILRQVDYLLDLLEKYKAKATFFVLGLLAERYPDLVQRLIDMGHEVASHGYAHSVIHRLSRNQFKEDTKRSKYLLEDIVGKPIRGYRAAEFSIRTSTLWAFEVLAELGFVYDSSVFPIHHRRYGIAKFYPKMMQYDLPNGLQIIEIPMATVGFGKINLPAAGGGYFRLMPSWLINHLVWELNQTQNSVVTYFHPYEFDPESLNVFKSLKPDGWKELLRGWGLNFNQNLGRQTMPAKLAELLKRFTFTTCQDFLNGAQINESRELF